MRRFQLVWPPFCHFSSGSAVSVNSSLPLVPLRTSSRGTGLHSYLWQAIKPDALPDNWKNTRCDLDKLQPPPRKDQRFLLTKVKFGQQQLTSAVTVFLHIFSLLEPVTSGTSFVLFPTGETGKINLCDSENLTEVVIAEQAGTEPIWMLWSSSRIPCVKR